MEGFKEFSSTGSQQEGHYFVLRLDDKYSGKEITCKGKKTSKAEDLEWILLVPDKTGKFTFSTEADGTVLTLTFEDAVFEAKA